jgi:hypothetical protein
LRKLIIEPQRPTAMSRKPATVAIGAMDKILATD